MPGAVLKNGLLSHQPACPVAGTTAFPLLVGLYAKNLGSSNVGDVGDTGSILGQKDLPRKDNPPSMLT